MRVEYLDHMGDDDAVADAARVSFDKTADLFPAEKNAALVRYLARGCSSGEWGDLVTAVASGELSRYEAEALLRRVRDMPRHWTPFAHTALKVRMTAPLPIRTQCFKHKQGFVENEQSRRYIVDLPELFVPDVFRAAPTGGAKQGSGGPHPRSAHWRDRYAEMCREAIGLYEAMVADGVCAEQARFALPQGAMVSWVWTGNLASFARFFGQRSDAHAQQEIRDLAAEVGKIAETLFPVAWDALTRR